MNKFALAIVTVTAIFATANNALSQDATATETVETVAAVEMTKEEIAANRLASTMEAMATICSMQDKIILSKDAIAACAGDEKKMPTAVKNGSRFTKARTGAEFNTLIANLAAFQ